MKLLAFLGGAKLTLSHGLLLPLDLYAFKGLLFKTLFTRLSIGNLLVSLAFIVIDLIYFCKSDDSPEIVD